VNSPHAVWSLSPRALIWAAATGLLIALAVALTLLVSRPTSREGVGHLKPAASVSSMDLARVNLGMSTREVRTRLGKPQRKERVGGAADKMECWRYPGVPGGFARLCFSQHRLVSKQQTSTG
jgi:hypothetical protein